MFLKIYNIKIENMNHTKQKSHIKGLKSPSKISIVRSKSTEHITSTNKLVPRKNLLEKATVNEVSMTKSSNLPKSKTVKSLKLKTKSTPKNRQAKSTKKIKIKSKKNPQSHTKTVKKTKILIKASSSEQSFNSTQSVKLPSLQFFLYQDTYISIQNSAQRRFVFKIKQIDQRNETSDTFFTKTRNRQPCSMVMVKQNKMQQAKNVVKQINTKESYVQTQKLMIVEFGTNTTPRCNNQICIQTQNAKFQENVEKCFPQTLTDLQFLFLPDENNFQGFSKPQRLHYKQLFESIAQKIWCNGQNLEELTEQKVQVLLYQRECIQMGMIEYYSEQGFPTHIYAVMSYLSNLFSFAQINEKEQALQRLHGISGLGYQQRLSRLLKGYPTKNKCSPILSQQLFLSLQKQLFKDHNFSSQTVQNSIHTHNKAVFDAVNQQLQKFKPFYYSKGQPFPWSINIGMTFFSIDQSTIGLLFKQIKEKVLMKFGYLCGLLIDYDEFKQSANNQKHQLHIKKLEHHEQRMIQEEIIETNYQAQIQEADASLMTDISNLILTELLDELCVDVSAFFQ